MALPGKKAKVGAYSGSVAFTGEATTATGNIIYQITDTTKRVWCKNCTITVKDGGTPTVESYTLDRLSGTITFGTATPRTITVDGSYLAVATIGCAFEYDYSLSADNVEATCFESDFISREQTLKGFEASLSKFYDVNHYFIDKWENDTDFVLELYSDGTTTPDVRAWTKISGDNPSAAVDGLVEESIDFEGTVDADGNCVSFGPF